MPELSPNRNVQVTDFPGERSPVSAVRKAHGFRTMAGQDYCVNACYRQLLAREDLVLTFLLRQLLESLDDDVASPEQGLERIGVDEIADRTLDRGFI